MAEFLSWTTEEAYSALVDRFSNFPAQSVTCAVPCWVVWEKQAVQSGGTEGYAKAMRQIAKINNVSDFWRTYLALPQPSELLEGGRIVRVESELHVIPDSTDSSRGTGISKAQHIDTLMFFREGVRPEWEDPKNKHGGHFQFQFRPGGVSTPPAQIDEYWNNLILGVFGGSLDGSDKITGIRLVDKMAGGRSSCIRMEVWFQNYSDTDAVNALLTSVENCIGTKLDGTIGLIPRSELKSHAD
jgi:translation initiation factor 4E